MHATQTLQMPKNINIVYQKANYRVVATGSVNGKLKNLLTITLADLRDVRSYFDKMRRVALSEWWSDETAKVSERLSRAIGQMMADNAARIDGGLALTEAEAQAIDSLIITGGDGREITVAAHRAFGKIYIFRSRLGLYGSRADCQAIQETTIADLQAPETRRAFWTAALSAPWWADEIETAIFRARTILLETASEAETAHLPARIVAAA